MTFDEVNQGMTHINGLVLRTEQHMFLTPRVAELEEQLRIAGIFINQFAEFCHHLSVEQI